MTPRASLVALLAALAAGVACSPTSGPVSARPGVAIGLTPEAEASLPANVWTTRVGAAGIEAVVSDGARHFALACASGSGDPSAILRIAPASGTGRQDIALAVDGPRPFAKTVGFDAWTRGGASTLVAAERPSDPEFRAFLAALGNGRALTVGGTRFSLVGARDALETALGPGGCGPLPAPVTVSAL